MNDQLSGMRALATGLLLMIASFVTSDAAAAVSVSLAEENISLSQQPPAAGTNHDQISALVGQLIIIGSDIPAKDSTKTIVLPCATSGLSAVTDTPHLQAVCDIGGGLDSFEVAYKPRYIGKSGNEHRWSVTATVSGLPATSSANRYAAVVINGVQYWLTMQYKSPTAVASALTVTQPPKRWVIAEKDAQISLQVQSKGAPISRLTIVNSSLQDADSNKRLNVDAFQVCDTQDCSGDVSLPGDKTTVIYLHAKADQMPFGQYSGALTFAADGGVLSKPIELLVFSSSARIKWIGTGLILLGVIFALIITVFFPHSAQRIESLRPAVAIRSSAKAWLTRLTNSETSTSETFPLCRVSLSDIFGALDDEKLESIGYVPGKIPLALKITNKAVKTYDAYLKENNDSLYVVAEIVATGIEPIVKSWADYSTDPNHLRLAKRALQDLDTLSSSTGRATVKTAVVAILSKLDSDIVGAGGRVGSRVSGGGDQTTTDSLTADLQTINAGAWLIWLIITIAGGWAALILTNSGFGTLRDLFTCFGWGLGLQVVGPQLQQLTTGKISKQIRVDIPQ